MKQSFRFMQMLLFVCTVDAFSGSGHESGGVIPTLQQVRDRLSINSKIDRKQIQHWHLAPVLMLAVIQPIEPASAAPFNEFPLLPLAPSAKVGNSSPSTLADTDVFKMLPRERILSGAVKELKDLQDLQDDRLNACHDKGIYWEQCFMFGQSDVDVGNVGAGEDSRGRMDYQLISPVGSLNPPSNTNKIPTW